MFYQRDYLKGFYEYPARVYEEGDELVLSNGLAERRFLTKPDFACVSLKNLLSGEQFLRSVKPEITVTLDGIRYAAGGVTGQFEHAFLKKSWYPKFGPGEDFHFVRYETGPIERSFHWKKNRWSPAESFPPAGICLKVYFASDKPALAGIEICVCHELFDNLPAFGKHFELVNHTGREIRLNEFEAEILAITEHDASAGTHDHDTNPPQARNIFAVSSIDNVVSPTFRYVSDPEYTSQVDFKSLSEILLISRPELGPYRRLKNGESFRSYDAYLMPFDETDRQRRMLQTDRFYQKLAPWTVENPILEHVVSTDPAVVRAEIDRCAEAGFEMLILSFGSGLNMEDDSDENVAQFKALADYAHEKGIRLGGYSLLASRSIDDENDVLSDHVIFGHSPCLCSKWGIRYFQKLRSFLERTGFDVLEHDGSYPGDVCHSTCHPGHECYEDSQYTQLMMITGFYQWCKERGIYLNVPDQYFLSGNNNSAMGYKEVNFSLPREQQVLLCRQNIYDGTYAKRPSMGWMFAPLVEYHGGGAAATIEPLCEHLDHYRMIMNNNLMAGVKACYRGVRLYDTEETLQMVRSSVSDYKAHRAIFESPFIHIRRPDGRDYDGYVHVNPDLQEKGLAVFFNPLEEEITRTIAVPLYFSGIEHRARAAAFGQNPQEYALERDYTISLTVTIPANDFIWFTIEDGE